jgi:hypothetical protein
MIEKRLFHSQQHTVLVPISSTVSLFSSFFFFPSPFFYLFLQPLEKRRRKFRGMVESWTRHGHEKMLPVR